MINGSNKILDILITSFDNPLSKFVKFYIENNNNNSLWLNNYFESRSQFYYENVDYRYENLNLSDIYATIESKQKTYVKDKILIKTILPRHFRGFKDVEYPIRLDSKLVVIDGRNSQGKTSLGESIEWLFTGRLSRRNSKDLGDSKELENCISNSFKPINENTWVEATFTKNEDIIKLKRELIKDYGKHQNDSCSSVLYLNDEKLSNDKEIALLDQLFGSVPPILMQHTLGDFVRNSPAERCKYFESLLNLDSLTSLIEKCFIPERFLMILNSLGTLPTSYKILNIYSITKRQIS